MPHAAYPCGVSSRTPRGPQDVRVLLRRRARAGPLIARRRGHPAPLRLQLDAYTRRACSCCRELAPHLRRRVDALVGELEGGDITAGDRAHIAGDLLATCPAIPDRERSILEWQTGWMLFCDTGGRSARGIALRLSHLRYMLHTNAWSDSSG